MQNQYIDIPFNVSDTPQQIIENLGSPNSIPSDQKEAANQLLKKLDELLKAPQNQLYIFYETVLTLTHKVHFNQKEEEWPESSSLEQYFDTQYKISSQNIYTEFWIRNYYNRVKSLNEEKLIDRMDLAWETYTSIFQLEIGRLNFHPIMLWDMFEGFLNYYFYYRTRKNVVIKEQIFNVTTTKDMFKTLAKQIPQNFNPLTITTKQTAGYYSLVALIIIAIHQKNYSEGINLVSKLSLREMAVYSRSFGSLLSLFLGISFCYFMMQDYSKTAKLCETITFFYQKHRKYFSKVSCRESISHLYQKCVSLLCLTYIFLEEKPKTAVMEIFKNISFKAKDRDGRQKVADCFYKMKQNDEDTFVRIFTLYSYEYHIKDLVQTGKERFKGLKEVTLNTIIQNYKRIQLSKMSKILNLSEEEIHKRLNSISLSEQNSCAWVTTVMNPMMKQTKKIKVEIQDDIAIFDLQIVDANDSSRQWQRYREQLAYLKEKIKTM